MSTEGNESRLRCERYVFKFEGVATFLELTTHYGGLDDGAKAVAIEGVPANTECRAIVGQVPLDARCYVTGVLELEREEIGFMVRKYGAGAVDEPLFLEVTRLTRFDAITAAPEQVPLLSGPHLEFLKWAMPERSHIAFEMMQMSGLRARIVGWSKAEGGYVFYGLQTDVRFQRQRIIGLLTGAGAHRLVFDSGVASWPLEPWRFVSETEPLFSD